MKPTRDAHRIIYADTRSKDPRSTYYRISAEELRKFALTGRFPTEEAPAEPPRDRLNTSTVVALVVLAFALMAYACGWWS